MNYLSRHFCLLLFTLLLAGCDLVDQPPDPAMVQQQIDAFRQQELELVRNTIDDPVHEQRFLELISERDALIARSTEAVNAYRKRMSVLNADYHADRGQFELLLNDFNKAREMAQAQFVDILSRMKRETTPAEWKEIARFQSGNLNPRGLVYRSVGEEG